jgi:SSS family solute:Na+ symporter
MSPLDWLVLFGTLGAIVAYGVWKTRGQQDMALSARRLSGQMAHHRLVGDGNPGQRGDFSVNPGQAYQDGMGFVQFYFGLPLAMIVLSVAFIPRYFQAARLYRLRVS